MSGNVAVEFGARNQTPAAHHDAGDLSVTDFTLKSPDRHPEHCRGFAEKQQRVHRPWFAHAAIASVTAGASSVSAIVLMITKSIAGRISMRFAWRVSIELGR